MEDVCLIQYDLIRQSPSFSSPDNGTAERLLMVLGGCLIIHASMEGAGLATDVPGSSVGST